MTRLAAVSSCDPLRSAHAQERRSIFYAKSDLRIPDIRLRGLSAEALETLHARTEAVAGLARAHGFHGPVAPLSAGTFHVVHRIGGADRRAAVVRSTVSDLFAEDDCLSIEGTVRCWLSRVDAETLVPETYAVGLSRAGAPFDFAILGLARGSSLRDLGDALLDDEPAYLVALGEALRIVHGVAGRNAGLLDCSPNAKEQACGLHACWSDYILLRLTDHVRICAEAGYIDHEQSVRILRHFDELASGLDGRPMRLLHGDPGIHNFCVDSDTKRVTAIIDWEDALVGDPLFDVAMVSTFQPPRRMGAFLSGYGLQRPSLDERRLLALYFLRIALSKTVHRLRFGVQDRPDRTPGHHRIYRGLDELDQLM